MKTPIIGKNTHLNHVICDPSLSYCVPVAVHYKLSDLLAPKHAGDRDAAKTALLGWYPTVWALIVPGFIMGDAFRFWQGRFDEAFATPEPAKGQRRQTTEEMAEGVRAMMKAEGWSLDDK